MISKSRRSWCIGFDNDDGKVCSEYVSTKYGPLLTAEEFMRKTAELEGISYLKYLIRYAKWAEKDVKALIWIENANNADKR